MSQKAAWLRILFSFLLVFALVLSFQFSPVAHSTTQADFDTFSETYYHLMKYFIHPLKPETLIHGAIKGIDVALTHQKISHTIPAETLTDNASEDLQTFRQTFEQVESQVGEKVKPDDLMTDALRGMFESSGDPYTIYLTPKEYRSLTEQMNGGNFGGIGIYIELEKGTKQLMVLEPIDDTPAAHAGLKSGDYITKIDDKPTKGIDLDSAQRAIRGPIGTDVTLTIRRKGSSAEKDYAIRRSLIRVKSVSSTIKDGNIGYVRLRTFGEFSGQEIEEALRTLEEHGARAYILDLRNNGGGYIDAAREVCSKFLPRGAVVVSVVERNGHVDKEFADGSEHPDYPMAVLVNEFSASASEIAAGALQDYHRARIIGTRTFGKGSVQTIIRLANKGAAKITIAHYATPSGRDIDKKGITPDIPIAAKGHAFDGAEDEQLQKAVGILKESLSERKAEMQL